MAHSHSVPSSKDNVTVEYSFVLLQYELTKLNEISKKLAYVMKKVYINYRIKRVKGDNFGMFFQNCLFSL